MTGERKDVNTHRWNVQEDQRGHLFICRGEHDKADHCGEHEEHYAPADELSSLRAALTAAAKVRGDGLTAPVVDRGDLEQAVQRAYAAGWNAAMGSPDDDFSVKSDADAILSLIGATTREEVERETCEALALMFERGTLAEGNSIQRDVPGVIRAQDSASLALLRSQGSKTDAS